MLRDMDEIDIRYLEYLWVILANKKEKELRLEGELRGIKADIDELNREIEKILGSKRKGEKRIVAKVAEKK